MQNEKHERTQKQRASKRNTYEMSAERNHFINAKLAILWKLSDSYSCNVISYETLKL